MHRPRTSKAVIALAAAAMLFGCLPVLAAPATNYVFTDNVPVSLPGAGVSLVILAGSKADSFTVADQTLTVSVAAGDSFTLRYPGPSAGDLANNGGLASCNLVGSNNEVTVAGPATNVVFTPTLSPYCGAVGGGSSQTSILPSIVLSAPNGGETVESGASYQVFWTAGGTGVQYVRLKLSTDGGASYPTTVADNLPNTGYYAWTVAQGFATAAGKLRIEAIGQGGTTIAADESDGLFTIHDLSVITVAPTIEADKNIEPPPPEVKPACVGGTRIKLPSDDDPRTQADSAVYYCGRDGKRYVFPDQYVYGSWYPDFSGIIVLSPAVMSSIPVGGNVTFKPATLVKLVSDPKVYVVSKGGRLRWVTTEEIAFALFGDRWWRRVHSVPDSFYLNYVLGEPITSLP